MKKRLLIIFTLFSFCSFGLFSQDSLLEEAQEILGLDETNLQEETISQEEFEYEDIYVIDNASIFSEDEFSTLNEVCSGLRETYDFGFYIATDNDPTSYDIELLAEDYYIDYNFGVGPEKNGILLMLNFADRNYDICCYGDDAHKVFTDSKKDYVADAFKPHFRNDNWYDGCMAFLQKSEDYYSEYHDKLLKAQLKAQEKELAMQEHRLYIDFDLLRAALLIGGGISLIIALAVCFSMKAKMKSVHIAKQASEYIPEDGIDITHAVDNYTHSTTKVIHHESSSSSHTSVNSRGFSHSSGKF